MVAEDAAIGEAYAAAAAAANPSMARASRANLRFPDPQDIATAVKDLIELPMGQRPLRTVVGSLFTEGVAEYNDASELASRRLLASIGRGL